MNQEPADGIEIETGRGRPVPEGLEELMPLSLNMVVRQHFRIPASDIGATSFWIGSDQFEIVNICINGIGIYLTRPDYFCVGGELQAIRLELGGESIGLQGRVVHITPDGMDRYLCGIEFINSSGRIKQIFGNYLKENLKSMFVRIEPEIMK